MWQKKIPNAEQISTRLLAGEFNGVPVVNDNGSVVGIVTALDILKAIQEGNEKLNTPVEFFSLLQREHYR